MISARDRRQHRRDRLPLGGFGGIIQSVMLSSIRQAIIPKWFLGRVFSSIGVLRAVAGIVGAAIGGWLGETIGTRPTILAGGVRLHGAVLPVVGDAAPDRHGDPSDLGRSG
jgi:hypothetical protein